MNFSFLLINCKPAFFIKSLIQFIILFTLTDKVRIFGEVGDFGDENCLPADEITDTKYKASFNH